MSPRAPDELVFAIDLTDAGLAELSSVVSGAAEPREPPPLPDPPAAPIRTVALLFEAGEDPLLLPVEPTRDVAALDALGRLLKVAVLSGRRLPAVAAEHGEELERRLAFERRLPRWVYDGLEPRLADRLPARVRAVLGPKR